MLKYLKYFFPSRIEEFVKQSHTRLITHVILYIEVNQDAGN